MSNDVKTPTLDKIHEVSEQSQAIGEFLDWLRHEKKLQLAEYVSSSWTCATCGAVPKDEVIFVSWFDDDSAHWRHRAKACKLVADRFEKGGGTIPYEKYEGDRVEHIAEGLYPAAVTIQSLLAEYFEIDEAAAERERRAILESIRRKAASR